MVLWYHCKTTAAHCLLPSTRWLLRWLPVLYGTNHTAAMQAECALLQDCFAISCRIYLLELLCFLSVNVLGCIVDHPVRLRNAWCYIVRIVCMHHTTLCAQPVVPQQCQRHMLIAGVEFPEAVLQPGELRVARCKIFLCMLRGVGCALDLPMRA